MSKDKLLYVKKGFTLIELLAVVVILSLIAVIATPIIINVIEKAKVNAKVSSVNMILDAVNTTYLASKLNLDDNSDLPTAFPIDENGGITINGLPVEYSGEKPISGTIVISNDGDVSAQNLVYSDGFVCTMGKGEKGSVKDKLVLPNMVDDPNIKGRKIFKGSNEVVANNYVNIYEDGVAIKYRIISIEEDGTIKVIRNDNITSMYFDTAVEPFIDGPRHNELNSYCNYNTPYYGCNAFMKVDGTFVNGNQSGLVTEDSAIKKYLNETFYNKLSDDMQNKIVIHTYDMKGASYLEGWASGKGTSISDLNGDLNSDLKWIGKVGLIDIRDFFLASSNVCNPEVSGGYYKNGVTDHSVYICSNNNYLYTIGQVFWTITPLNSNRDSVFFVRDHGGVDNGYAFYSNGVRPTFYLSNSIKLTGSGTSSSPFEIE